MAQVEDFKHLYEVLIRFDEQSKFKGAHAQYLEVLKIDGVVRSASVGDAVPLSEADLSEVMSEAQAAAMDEAVRLKVELETTKAEASMAAQEAEQTITGLKQSLAAATQQKMDHATRAANAEASLDQTQKASAEAVSARDARIAELEAMVAQLQKEAEPA